MDVIKVHSKWLSQLTQGQPISGSSRKRKLSDSESYASTNEDVRENHISDLNENAAPTLSGRRGRKKSESSRKVSFIETLSTYT